MAVALLTLVPASVRADSTVFNDPGAPSALEDREVADIVGAPAGTEILVANPFMYRTFATPLMDALERGVEVHWVTLERTYLRYRYGGILAEALRSTPGSSVTVCPASCTDASPHSPPGIITSMHAKTLQLVYPDGTFRTEIGSNDWTPSVPRREYNSLVVTTDPVIGRATHRWLTCLLQQQGRSCYPKVVHSGRLTLTQFPNAQRTGTNNPYYRFLRPVSCAHRARVWVLSSVWQPVMRPVVHRLAHLHRQGCRVRIVASVHRTSAGIVRALTRAHLDVRWSANPDPLSGGVPHNHTKEMVISGTYGGHVVRAMLDGSYNLGEGAYSDNNMIEQSRVGRARFSGVIRHLREQWRSASPTR